MYGLGRNESSFSELLQSFDYDLITRLEALVNHPHRPDRLAGLYGAHTDFVIAADNCHLMASLRLRNSALWEQQSALFHAGFDTHTSILAGTENVTGIGKGSNDANRTRVWIHLPVGQQDFAFLRVGTAVRQDQFDGVSEKTDGVLAGSGVVLFLHEDVFPFANREKRLDRLDLRNRSQDRGGSNQVADLDLCNPRDPIHQRGDFGPLQVERGLLYGGPARFDGGLGPKLGLNLVIQLALGNGPGFRKRCVALHIKRAFAKLCLRLRKVALRSIQRGLKRPRIYFEQYLAFADERTFCVVLIDYVT